MVRTQTRGDQPELVGLLEEAHELYWDCFSRLKAHEYQSNGEWAVVLLTTGAFKCLQSAVALLEMGYYAQAAVLIRLLMSHYLLAHKYAHNVERAKEFCHGPDWAKIAEVFDQVNCCLEGTQQTLDLALQRFRAAVEKKDSSTAYVRLGEVGRIERETRPEREGATCQEQIDTVRTELKKSRAEGITELLSELGEDRLGPGGLSRDRVVAYMCDAEFLHRHAHGAREPLLLDVFGDSNDGALSHFPRYERAKLVYFGGRTITWSVEVLRLVTATFQLLLEDDEWKQTVESLMERFLEWWEAAQSQEEGATP
jgi:hypothetical protein